MRQPPYELQAGENRPETVLIPGPELLTIFPPLDPVTPGLQQPGNQQGLQLNSHPCPAGMYPVQAAENRSESIPIHGPEMSIPIFPSHEQVAAGLHGNQQGLQLNPHPFPIGMCPVHQLRSMNGDDIPPPKADFSAPPPYDLATKLPTYEEVQREKSLQGEIPLSRTNAHRPQALAFLAIDTETSDSDGENGLLGTDFMFFTAFFVAFLFNWIGFLLLMCFCHTVAARYGALSGFGLSLAKWTLIVKHSTELASHENSWLWWLIMAFGLLICVRAIIQYLNIKRGWRLLSGSAQERLLFFY